MGAPFLIIFILSAILFKRHNITVGTLTLFLQLLNRITVPFTHLNSIYIQFSQTKVSLDRLNDIFVIEEAVNKKTSMENKIVSQNAIESIEFRNVSFKYKDRLSIRNINLYLKSGKHYGIIGENGSGKTTFLKLLLNLFSPDSGSIAANDIEYDVFPFTEMREGNKIVYIEDNSSALFDDFDKNITLSIQKDNARFLDTLEMVGLFDQYQEFSSKNAEELSSGQKQRVAFARGLYHLKSETILVIDEPFSAMDANGIKKMYEILNLCKNKLNLTIFEITHNLSDMERFDHIYYFEDGKIVLEGKHNDLMIQEKYRLFIQNYKKSI
jgi:ATP-binding cassette subfamily B protein